VKGLARFLLQAVAAGLVAFALVTYFAPAQQSPSDTHPVVIGQPPVSTDQRKDAASSYSAAVRQAIPSVVNVYAMSAAVRPSPLSPQDREGGGLGSGVVVSSNGYILTNNHVVQGASAVAVSLAEGKPAPAKVVGTDPETDLAVLKIDARDLRPIALGDSDTIQIGDVVLAIGNPFGVGQTVTQGIVSGTGRNRVGINTFENFIQTDAAINPGNSGGALVDTSGRLIGINTAILSPSGGSLGIGFAIPVRTANEVMKQLIEGGRVSRGWIGVEAQDLTPQLSRSLGLKPVNGALLVRLMAGGPGETGGLRPGDIVTAVDGKPVSDTRDLINATAAIKPGAQGEFSVLRDDKEVKVRVAVGRRPPITNSRRE